MNRIAARLLTAAAALVVVTGIASAQALNVDVPFAFRAGNDLYPAGSYRVVIEGGNNLVHFTSAKTRDEHMMLPSSSEWAPKEWREKGEPTLGFECGLSRCTLVKVWTGIDASALNMPHPRLGRGEVATLRVIHAVRLNGD